MSVGFTLAATLVEVAAHAPALPSASSYELSSGRLLATVAGVVGLAGAVVGGLALARATGRIRLWSRDDAGQSLPSCPGWWPWSSVRWSRRRQTVVSAPATGSAEPSSRWSWGWSATTVGGVALARRA